LTRPASWGCRAGKCNAGGGGGPPATSTSRTGPGGASRLFPPLDRAVVRALACEAVAETGLPVGRQSLADLVGRARRTLNRPIGRTTVWRVLHEDAIKPWQFRHWIFPRDPDFAAKASPILDLYQGLWDGRPLGEKDFVLSSDEKTGR
jgi:hypothetical protein